MLVNLPSATPLYINPQFVTCIVPDPHNSKQSRLFMHGDEEGSYSVIHLPVDQLAARLSPPDPKLSPFNQALQDLQLELAERVANSTDWQPDESEDAPELTPEQELVMMARNICYYRGQPQRWR